MWRKRSAIERKPPDVRGRRDQRMVEPPQRWPPCRPLLARQQDIRNPIAAFQHLDCVALAAKSNRMFRQLVDLPPRCAVMGNDRHEPAPRIGKHPVRGFCSSSELSGHTDRFKAGAFKLKRSDMKVDVCPSAGCTDEQVVAASACGGRAWMIQVNESKRAWSAGEVHGASLLFALVDEALGVHVNLIEWHRHPPGLSATKLAISAQSL